MNTTIAKPTERTYPEAAKVRTADVADVQFGIPRLHTVWTILRYTFGLVPIVAGLDKFTNLLVSWVSYLNPLALSVIPVSGQTFMHIVGVIEIAAGIIVLARPRPGAFIVMAWLVCIALSLIASGRYLDVAVRDLVMAIGAFTLANLTAVVRPVNAASSHRS